MVLSCTRCGSIACWPPGSCVCVWWSARSDGGTEHSDARARSITIIERSMCEYVYVCEYEIATNVTIDTCWDQFLHVYDRDSDILPELNIKLWISSIKDEHFLTIKLYINISYSPKYIHSEGNIIGEEIPIWEFYIVRSLSIFYHRNIHNNMEIAINKASNSIKILQYIIDSKHELVCRQQLIKYVSKNQNVRFQESSIRSVFQNFRNWP